MTQLNQAKKFVMSKKPNAQCFFTPNKYEITDNETAEDIGSGTDELSACLDAAERLGYNAELTWPHDAAEQNR